MKAEEFLNRIKKLHMLINSTQEVIDSMSMPGAVNYEKNIGGKCSVRENIEESKQIHRQEIIEMLDKYMRTLKKYHHAAIMATVSNKVSALSKIILEQRYLLDKSWKETAQYLGYDEVYVKRKLYQDLLDDCEKVAFLYERLEM